MERVARVPPSVLGRLKEGIVTPSRCRAAPSSCLDVCGPSGPRRIDVVRSQQCLGNGWTPAEAAGMPAAWIAARKRDAAGNLVLGMDYPTVIPFLELADNADARRRVWLAKNRTP
jgi:hypothetical protein